MKVTFGIGIAVLLSLATIANAQALGPEDAPAASPDTEAPAAAVPSPAPIPEAVPAQVTTSSEAGAALSRAIAALAPETSDEERNERAAIVAFYAARANEPLFVAPNGLTPAVVTAAAEFANADAWGLEPRDFAMPDVATAKDGAPPLAADARAVAELKFATTLQLYARYARGGRIINPSEQLNSNLDRRPQFAKPAEVIAGFAAAPDAAEIGRAHV